jgi:hypothetical protein
MKLPAFDHSRVLLVAGDGRAAILYTRTHGCERARHKRFKDAVAALAWCQRQAVPMIWLPPARDPQGN